MTKRNKIIYWISTLWLALGMTSTGIVQLIKMKEEVDKIVSLGYPEYILTLLGIWKLLGVVALFLRRYPVVREWAYAGFFFSMSGAIYSHLAAVSVHDIYPALLLLVLTAVSWYFKPEQRAVLIT